MKKPHQKIGRHLHGVRFIDDLPRLDARRLEVLDPLFSGQTPCCTLLRHGRPCGTADVEVGDACVLIRAVRPASGYPNRLDITIKLHFFLMPRGGTRRAFVCPLCSRTAPILFLAGPVFSCRHCVALPYRSQNVAPLDRASGMAGKYRKRLFLGPSDPVRMAKRKRHMKRSKFERLKWEVESRERQARLAAFAMFYRRFP